MLVRRRPKEALRSAPPKEAPRSRPPNEAPRPLSDPTLEPSPLRQFMVLLAEAAPAPAAPPTPPPPPPGEVPSSQPMSSL